jgi:hypothetical protein
MKKKTYLFTIFAALIALNGSSASASLKDAQVAFKSGNWKVLRSIDAMKDTVDCTGIYKENYGVQLTNDALYVSIKGGIETVTLRFSDKPARSMRLAEKMEKNIRSIIISGTDFSELIESDRLRVQASTLVSGIANEDFDLSGIKDALESIRTKCPIQANVTTTTKLEPERPTVPLPEKPSPPVCSDVLKSKMKAQGLKEKQILSLCS